MLENYLVNGKPLGFTSNDLNSIIMEVLGSYLPIKPNNSMLTGKPILTQPTIILFDSDSKNILFSNIVVASTEEQNPFVESFINEVTIKLDNGVSIRMWKSKNFPYLYENTLKVIRKTCVGISNPYQIFLNLIYNGAKGIISVSVTDEKSDDFESVTNTVHYQDILKYRMFNAPKIESVG